MSDLALHNYFRSSTSVRVRAALNLKGLHYDYVPLSLLAGEQHGAKHLAQMIWSVREHTATLSRAVTLAPGDIIMTGTPAGVGAVVPGDVLTGGVDGIAEFEVTVGPRA